MDEQQRQVVRQTAAITLACIAGSVVITAAATYLLTGSLDLGIGMFIAILAPAILVPAGSYNHISLAARLREANDQLRTLSETDPLTHTYNRRRFLEVADVQLALARRHCFPTSVLLIDFDRFKDINDQLGHLAGDRVLVEASRIIRQTLRDSDTLARFGGEEFIVLLPHTAREGALMVAERILTAIREHAFEHDGSDLKVTVSIGGVTCETSETTLERMTSKADGLMYAAKQAGRDRYMIEGLPRQATLPFRDAAAGSAAPQR
jgi:diguanylate cyclase (GGDEF)-like protein